MLQQEKMKEAFIFSRLHASLQKKQKVLLREIEARERSQYFSEFVQNSRLYTVKHHFCARAYKKN